MIKADVLIDLSDVTEVLSEENHRRAMYYMLDAQALPDMQNYVPLDGGELRMSGHAEDFETLVWDAPYAKAQYDGTAGQHKGFVSDKQRRWFFANMIDDNGNYLYEAGYTTPGTGPKWDEVAKGNHMNDWINAYLKGAGYE